MELVTVSTEFDNSSRIAEDLLRGLGDPQSLEGVKLGVLMCGGNTAYAEVLEKVSKAVEFPIIGGTTLSFPMTGRDDAPVSATLALLRNDKMKIACAVSPKLDDSRAAEQMRAVYAEARAALGEEPRLIVPYIPMLPGLNTDSFVSALFELSGGAPVFGGVCTSDLAGGRAAVFAGGAARPQELVLLLVGGAVSPVFAVGNTITRMAEYGPEVTEADGNIVRRVDDTSICDYMQSLGIAPQDRVNGLDAMMQYGPLPVLVRHQDQPDDGVPEVRCISYTQVGEGSAAFSAKIPLGARINIGLLRPDDVARSAKDCLERLMAGAAEGRSRGYSYSAVFCVSCVARYFVFVGMRNKERQILADIHPEGLAVSDYYGFCELGPTSDKSGKIINRSHSASIAMCAF